MPDQTSVNFRWRIKMRTALCSFVLTLMTAAVATAIPPDQPQPDPSGLDKNRFISFFPGNAGQQTAIRVRLVALHHVDPPYTGGATVPFTQFEGQSLYAGPPHTARESFDDITTRYIVARLSCVPYYRDWTEFMSCSGIEQICAVAEDCKLCGAGSGTVVCTSDSDCTGLGPVNAPPCQTVPDQTCSVPVSGIIHLTGEAIVPSSTYEVEILAASCADDEEACPDVSASLSVSTARNGDVMDPFSPASPTSQPDFDDIAGMVAKFKNLSGAPIMVRAKLDGIDNRGLIRFLDFVGFSDIGLCVDAFVGRPYPYKPGRCTGDPGDLCLTDADCLGDVCHGGSDAGKACDPDCGGGGVCGPNAPCILCP
jgi:hypothetical protein